MSRAVASFLAGQAFVAVEHEVRGNEPVPQGIAPDGEFQAPPHLFLKSLVEMLKAKLPQRCCAVPVVFEPSSQRRAQGDSRRERVLLLLTETSMWPHHTSSKLIRTASPKQIARGPQAR